MTERKRFKRRVRSRAAKTGESYMVARRLLEHRSGQEHTLSETNTITDQLHGFSLDLPAGWKRVDPSVTASHWQVAAFDGSGEHAHRYAALLILPTRGRSLDEVATSAVSAYTKSRVEGLEVHEAKLAGLDARRVVGHMDTRGTTIHVIEHIAIDDDRVLRLAVRTNDMERDQQDAAQIAKSFRAFPPAAPLSSPGGSPPRTDRALRTIRLAASIANELNAGPPTTAHLVWGLAADEDGVAAVALRDVGMDADRIRTALGDPLPEPAPSSSEVSDDLAHVVGTVAPSVAVGLGHYYVGTEHLLLAVLGHDCPGQALLTSLGVQPPALRASVATILTSMLEERITSPPAG